MTDTSENRTFHDPDPTPDDAVSAGWLTAVNRLLFSIFAGAETKAEARTALDVYSKAEADVADDHGGLTGLADDDHTQYLLADGTRTLAGNLVVTGLVDGRDVAVDGTKLDGIESGATADQSAAEIKTLYESNANTNEFSDAEQTKLAGIESGAAVDQNAAEVSYDNTASGLTAADVQAAVDEVVAAGGGTVKQIVTSSISAVFTTSVAIPYDDTIPQNTEGGELLTVTITPTSATSKLFFSLAGYFSTTQNGLPVTAALFVDSVASALAASNVASANSGDRTALLQQQFHYTPGDTNSHTFKIRIGAGATDTIHVNADSSGNRRFGGVSATTLTVIEYE